MRILCVATKLPWPPVDGGRLALALTLQALADAGNDVEIVAPADADHVHCAKIPAPRIGVRAVAAPRPPWPIAAARAIVSRQPLTVVRHRHRRIERAVAAALDAFRPDVVHAEQLQSLANCSAAISAGFPLLLRMQNVESDLWQQMAAAGRSTRLLAGEARRLRRAERHALQTADHTLALTENDAAALRARHPSIDVAHIEALAPPFPSRLPAGRELDGEPAIALSGSAGWRPNEQALRWFLEHVMPRLVATLPRAVVHVFGGATRQETGALRWHRAPDDSVDAFPGNAIVALPLQIGSGIRMRILEAWARGLPVVASSVAARGLHVTSGRELAIADSAQEFCAALGALAADRGAREASVAAGRAYLAARHDPTSMTSALLDSYRRAIETRCARGVARTSSS